MNALLEIWQVLPHGKPTRLAAKIWKTRYPAMQVVTPPGAHAKVEELPAMDTVAPDFEDPSTAAKCAFAAMMGMRKIDVAAIEAAVRG